MRTALAIAVFLLLVVSAPSLAAQVVPSERVRNAVNVREEPLGDPAEIVGQLRRGESAELIESVPYFHRIRLQNGVEGYVSKSWTKVTDDASGLPTVSGNLEIHFIDVGQGDGNLLICPNGSTIMIDGGSSSGRSPDEVRSYVIDAIEPYGTEIDYLIVTHPDTDHYNLLPDVLDGVPIGLAYYTGASSDYRNRSFHTWVRETPERFKRLGPSDFDQQASPNPDIDCGDAQIWILAAAVEGSRSRKNAMSIVVMIRYGDFEALMTGDATHATENVILRRYNDSWLDADLLKIGHHGSLATSTSENWADTIKPEIAIASAGYTNSYGHPREEVINRLTPHTVDVAPHEFRSATRRQSGRPKYKFETENAETEGVYSTAVNGNIAVISDGTGYEVVLNQGESQ